MHDLVQSSVGGTREVERDEESAYTESDLEDSLSY